MKKNQIAAQLYTLRDFCKTAEDYDKSLKKVKDIGYDAVQVSGIGPIDPKQVKEIADRHDLGICATHVSYDRLKEDLAAVIEEHRLWDCRYVGLGSMPQQFRTSKEGFLQVAQEFSEIGKELQQAGLQFIYHDHKFEFEKYDGVTGMDLLLNESDEKAFGFELDTYWVHAGGADLVQWIEKVKGRMQVVHLKDMAIEKDQQMFAEVGEGNFAWDRILEALRSINVEWYVVEQDTCRRDPFESLAISYRYLAERALAE